MRRKIVILMLAFSIFSFTACGFDSANIDVTENEQEVAQDNSVLTH